MVLLLIQSITIMQNRPKKPVKTTKGRKFQPVIYSKDEVMSLVDSCNNGPSGLRNKVLIIVLYRCGLRISEALGVCSSDYNAQEGTLRIIGKGKKLRMVGVDAQTKMHLDQWMEKRSQVGVNGRGNPPIFCGISKNNLGKQLQTAYVRNLLKRLGKNAGIEKRMNPHGMRHTFAHDLLNEGIGLNHIQITLGHSSIATTSKYLQQFNPRETLEKIRERVW